MIDIAKDAHDPLDLEENYIVQQLNSELSDQFDVYSQ